MSEQDAGMVQTVRADSDTDSLHTTLGVLGGGQLGRMLVHAAQAMGYDTVVLDPQADGPAGQASQQQVVAAYDDAAGWQQLADACDGITTEFENVPAAALAWLAERKPVSPEVAVRLGKLFGDGPGVWVRMQAAYDTWHAERAVDVSAIPTLELV